MQNLESDQIADSIIWKDFLNINLKMRTSDVFKDGEPPEDAEDPGDEVKMKETDAEAEPKGEEPSAGSEEKADKKPAEDTTPPIQVRR